MNPYAGLLTIKQLRESEAEVRVARERAAVQAARTAHEQAQTLLTQLRSAERDTGQRLYGDLCDRVVHVRDIDEVKLAVIALRERVAHQHEIVLSAQGAEREAESALEVARNAHRHAQRQTSKFVELTREIDLEMKREAEQREESEMEESALALRQGHDEDIVDSIQSTSSEDMAQ